MSVERFQGVPRQEQILLPICKSLLVQPDRQMNSDLSFPPEKLVATREMRRWMKRVPDPIRERAVKKGLNRSRKKTQMVTWKEIESTLDWRWRPSSTNFTESIFIRQRSRVLFAVSLESKQPYINTGKTMEMSKKSFSVFWESAETQVPTVASK